MTPPATAMPEIKAPKMMPAPVGMALRAEPKKGRGCLYAVMMTTAALLVIGGGLFFLAFYGLNRFKNATKIAEARDTVGQIAKAAQISYVRGKLVGASIRNNTLCGSASPVPASIDEVKGKKYQSSPADWKTGDETSGWTCLRFSLGAPQLYRYEYQGGTSSYLVIANGDIDADGVLSTFTMGGTVAGGHLVNDPDMKSTSEDE
jgi:type IV pilus assembly protein PilA